MKDIKADKVLVRGIISGNESDFRVIYDRYRDKLYTYGLKITKSEEVAEEIIHQVFLKIWTHRENLNPELSFNALLYKITKNFALNFLEKASRSAALQQELYYYFDQQHNATEDEIIYDDYSQLAEKAIDLLPPQQKRIFHMHRVEGMTYKEIADALHLSKGTVKNHMLHSLKFLRKYLHTHTDLTFCYGCLCFIEILSTNF
jgi:RNA polymerase sigma-70 factor (family 1)